MPKIRTLSNKVHSQCSWTTSLLSLDHWPVHDGRRKQTELVVSIYYIKSLTTEQLLFYLGSRAGDLVIRAIIYLHNASLATILL